MRNGAQWARLIVAIIAVIALAAVAVVLVRTGIAFLGEMRVGAAGEPDPMFAEETAVATMQPDLTGETGDAAEGDRSAGWEQEFEAPVDITSDALGEIARSGE